MKAIFHLKEYWSVKFQQYNDEYIQSSWMLFVVSIACQDYQANEILMFVHFTIKHIVHVMYGLIFSPFCVITQDSLISLTDYYPVFHAVPLMLMI